MVKKLWILMLVMCVLTLGASNAIKIGSVDQFKINSPIEYGNLENYQSAFHNYTEYHNEKNININSELSIKKLDNHIVMDPVVGTTGDNVQIKASLINNLSGKGVPRQKISFYGPDGKIIGEANTNNDGKATCDYIITQTPNEYSLKASYEGSLVYNPTDSINTLQVNRWNLTMHVDDIKCKYGDTVPVIVTLTNSTNKAPIVGKMVNFRLGDGTFINQGKTDGNGQFIYNYTVSNRPGENLMEATVNRDLQYNSKVHYFELTVNKSDSKLSVNDMTCTRGNVCKLQANLSTQTDKPLSNETIIFYNNGTKIGENKTDNIGQVSYSYICDATGGFHLITVKYSGNDYYSPIESILQLHVYNWKTVLKIDNITAKPGQIVTVKALLIKSITGEPLANKEVEFSDYNSDFIGSNMTNGEGVVQIKYRVPLQSKTYRVSAHFNAEQEYSCSDIAAYIVVADNTSTFNLNILKNPNNLFC